MKDVTIGLTVPKQSFWVAVGPKTASYSKWCAPRWTSWVTTISPSIGNSTTTAAASTSPVGLSAATKGRHRHTTRMFPRISISSSWALRRAVR